ncbi:MAG: hypothetical protein A2219_05430 [Elusimicrobia bacterium RIFOXYA2_FULL_50_26]|nr:MAG: hypothetical protein A2219_05430 [Elusimicrobia bacterium RIFOXYA2_FULL_50_26]OGS24323.1 MAG: hypothetical protein A2314_00790 [Elusimicrobia bacterium RIFOXYB2_FULL_50_12]
MKKPTNTIDFSQLSLPARQWLFIPVFLLLAVSIIGCGYLYYNNQKRKIRQNIADNLTAIIDSKVREITQWRKEQLIDVSAVINNPFIMDRLRQFVSLPDDPLLAKYISAWISFTRKNYGYDNVIICNMSGRILASAAPVGNSVKNKLRSYATSGAHEVNAELVRYEDEGRVCYDVFIPFRASGDAYLPPVGFVVTQADPEKYLYPLLQSWPSPSATAETLLIKRDGQDIVYLNNLRHRQDTAMKFKLPVLSKELPAAMAVRGYSGVFEGKDYRGTKVMSVIKPVPESAWYIVAKVDNSEIYAPLRYEAWAVSGATLLMIFLSVLGMLLVWYRQRLILAAHHYHLQKKTEEQIRYAGFHDSLTGLYNRAYFEEELTRFSASRELPVSVVMGDVNNLKLTNDIFGHSEGDRLLKALAGIIQSSCREDDIIARWGGDEYIILLPNTSLGQAEIIVNRIRNLCTESKSFLLHFSISLGTAARETSDQKMEDVIRIAEEKMYNIKVLESKDNRENVINSMLGRLARSGYETSGHIERMQKIAVIVARKMGLPGRQVDELELYAALHDIGKAAMRDDLLSKPDKLTPEEWDKMKYHTEIGYRIVHSFPELNHAADAVLYHHERWDGAGYPMGLKTEQIPLLVRLLSIIEAYDVMTHERPYKKAVPPVEALEELRRQAGKQFDPRLVTICASAIEEYQNQNNP